MGGSRMANSAIGAIIGTVYGGSFEGVWRRVAHARAQVPRSAARRVPVCGWAAQSPAAGGRKRGV